MIPMMQTVQNPVTGIFGTGNIQWFTSSGTWLVPPGINSCRVRMWGAAGNASSNGGSAGGFSLKEILDLSSTATVVVTVGVSGPGSTTNGGTSSFGSYCSATGGVSNGGTPGTGVGGDINTTGGAGGGGGGGGSASLFGDGGIGGSSLGAAPGAGGGSSSAASVGGNGFMSTGGINHSAGYMILAPTAGAYLSIPSIDYLGTGGGGGYQQAGVNGGGNGNLANRPGSFPAGGSGGTNGPGGAGLVIVEW